MIMADVFKILFLILGMLLCTVSYWLLFQALFSDKVEQNRLAMLAHPYRAFMVGFFAGLPLLLLGIALLSGGAGPFKFLGGALLVGITTVALFGSTGLVRHIGDQLGATGSEGRGGLSVLRGGAVVTVACVLPFVGWFFLIPLVLITGFGAGMRTLWSRRAPTTPIAISPAEAVQA